MILISLFLIMTIKDLLPFFPEDCPYTVLDLAEERKKARADYARGIGKRVEDLTPEEYQLGSQIPALDDPCDAFRD